MPAVLLQMHPPAHRRIPVDHECAHSIPGRRLRIEEVWFDQQAIRIGYAITPALPGGTRLHWSGHAEDDLGNRYEDRGGAYGLSADGQRTEGVLSLMPLPPAEAGELRIVVDPLTESGRPTACALAVRLRRD